MEEKDYILAELESVAPSLAAVSKLMPYEVPESYFELLPVKMLGKVDKPIEKLSVPEGYFDRLPAIMLSKVKGMEATNELDLIAPSLVGISKKMPYTVPVGYFDNLSVPVQTSIGVEATSETPVISIHQNRSMFKWAVAASVIVLAGLFTWQSLRSPSTGINHPIAGSTKLADTVLNNEFAAALASLDDVTLHEELYESGMPTDTKSILYYLNTENFEKALHEFTVEELKAQLAVISIKNNS